jgi:hypothetical protein
MRCIYQKVVGVHDCKCDEKLRDFFGTKFKYYCEAMHSGWYGMGCRREVPKEACYVGRYGKVFVWVTPEGIEDLTRITLAILDIATVQPTSLAQRLNPDAAEIAALFEKAKKIEAVLTKYPGDKKQSDAYKRLQKQLEATMCLLANKLEGSKEKYTAPMLERKNLYNSFQQQAIPMIPP